MIVNQNKIPDEHLVIVLMHQPPFPSHACLSVDGFLYSYEPGGISSKLSTTLQRSIEKVKSGKGSVDAITLIFLNATSDQKEKIKKRCEEYRPALSCMHALSIRISDVAQIPLAFSICPDVTYFYLKNVSQLDESSFSIINSKRYKLTKQKYLENAKISMLITALLISASLATGVLIIGDLAGSPKIKTSAVAISIFTFYSMARIQSVVLRPIEPNGHFHALS